MLTKSHIAISFQQRRRLNTQLDVVRVAMNIIHITLKHLVMYRSCSNEEKVVSFNLYVMLIHRAAIKATRLSRFGLNSISLCYKQLDTNTIFLQLKSRV